MFFLAGPNGEMPDHIRAELERRADESKLLVKQFEEFLAGMTHDERDMLHSIFMQFSTDKKLPAYYAGILIGYQHRNDGSCLGCGNVHDDAQDAVDKILGAAPTVQQKPVQLVDIEALRAQVEKDEERPVWHTSEDEYDRLAELYRVNPLEIDAERPMKEMRVLCKGCGIVYPNLGDRMVKKPEECSGCFIKAAQG